MDKLGKILPRVLAKQPNRGRLIEVRVRSVFREMLGPELSEQCEVVDLHGTTLGITTTNPALAHQLRIDSETILARLNQDSLGRRLERIQVRTGRPSRQQ